MSAAFRLSGPTSSAPAMVGTAVLMIVVSSASMKKATATSHGSRRLTLSALVADEGDRGHHGVGRGE
ncbi:hypothetical protein ACFS07_14500 [Undibacterium arcticum]